MCHIFHVMCHMSHMSGKILLCYGHFNSICNIRLVSCFLTLHWAGVCGYMSKWCYCIFEQSPAPTMMKHNQILQNWRNVPRMNYKIKKLWGFDLYLCPIVSQYEAVSEWVTERVLCEEKNHSTGLPMSDPHIMVPNKP